MHETTTQNHYGFWTLFSGWVTKPKSWPARILIFTILACAVIALAQFGFNQYTHRFDDDVTEFFTQNGYEEIVSIEERSLVPAYKEPWCQGTMSMIVKARVNRSIGQTQTFKVCVTDIDDRVSIRVVD